MLKRSLSSSLSYSFLNESYLLHHVFVSCSLCQVASQLAMSRWQFGLRLSGMVALSFAAYGWALLVLSALLCRRFKGSERL